MLEQNIVGALWPAVAHLVSLAEMLRELEALA